MRLKWFLTKPPVNWDINVPIPGASQEVVTYYNCECPNNELVHKEAKLLALLKSKDCTSQKTMGQQLGPLSRWTDPKKKWEHVQLWAVSKRFCSSEGAKGMLARQLTRCLRARSLCWCLRAGIAYADAYAGLRTPGFCLREVRIATLLLEMKQGVLDVAQLMVVDKANGFSRPWCLRFLPRTTHSAREFSHRAAILITITISIL